MTGHPGEKKTPLRLKKNDRYAIAVRKKNKFSGDMYFIRCIIRVLNNRVQIFGRSTNQMVGYQIYMKGGIKKNVGFWSSFVFPHSILIVRPSYTSHTTARISCCVFAPYLTVDHDFTNITLKYQLEIDASFGLGECGGNVEMGYQ